MSPWFPRVPLFGRSSAEGAADGPGIHSWTQIRIFVGTRRGDGVCVRHARSLLHLGIRDVPFHIPRFFNIHNIFTKTVD